MDTSPAATTELATFAGGCFWCIEAVFTDLEGVEKAVSGFEGEDAVAAEYKTVARGGTAYREAVQVTYDPKKVPYQALLDIFWRQIDPTDSGGQFADRGSHYQTAIYFHTLEQERLAKESKAALEKSGKFSGPIATEILPFTRFTPADEEHQNFAKKCPLYYKNYKEGSGRAAYIEEVWGK